MTKSDKVTRRQGDKATRMPAPTRRSVPATTRAKTPADRTPRSSAYRLTAAPAQRMPAAAPRTAAASIHPPLTLSPPHLVALRHATGVMDYPLVFILATLLAVGAVMVFSASFVQYGTRFFIRQLLWIGLGIGVLIGFANIPYRVWQRWAIPIMGGALVLLLLVLIIGEEILGAKRTFFGGRVQPSELAKLAVIIYSAAWVASRGKQLVEARTGLIPFAVIMGLVAGLIVLEPSFSVAIIILVIGVVIFYVGGGDTRQLVIMGLIGVVILALIISQSHHGMQRISDWWRLITDPGQTPRYHVIKEFFSRGFFHISLGGDPNEWLDKWAVPLLWSDYLFVNIGHDLGFLGAAGVAALFAALGYRGLGIALRAPDQFGSLTAVGITTWILTQATVHIGTALALIPATGQPLPFMSYGGSAMVSCMAGAGLLLSISRASGERREPNAGATFGRGNGRARLSDLGRGGRASKG